MKFYILIHLHTLSVDPNQPILTFAPAVCKLRPLRQHQKRCEAFLNREDDANRRRKATANSNKVKPAAKHKDALELCSSSSEPFRVNQLG